MRLEKEVRIIDLFAGIGGIRCGLETALLDEGYNPKCVFTSEIKPHAISVLSQNYPNEPITGDITKVDPNTIPDFDILCAGFPCQTFSSAGKRQGFADTRGTMFFYVEKIIETKVPLGFILENVEGLVNHDKGNTLRIIIDHLKNLKHNGKPLNYKVSYKVLNSSEFGVPQDRKRIYIVGSLNKSVDLENFEKKTSILGDILERGLPIQSTKFTERLLKYFKPEELYGKSIKDKRGGKNNIHSWDIELKGKVSKGQKVLLNKLLCERRKKHWSEIIGIDWMDGMPLTLDQIRTFADQDNLQEMLDDLVEKGYLRFEHPKKLIKGFSNDGHPISKREYDLSKPKGYNIVAGKLSFEVSKILNPNEIAPTLVAMDMQKLYVVDKGGIRRLSLREGLRLCGYPETYKFEVKEREGFDLLGNTVVVPVIKSVAKRLISTIK
jgi:DNA (cytosine-5)-methyltransferase 1